MSIFENPIFYIVAVIVAIVLSILILHGVIDKRADEIRAIGYDNPEEVQIFCRRIGASLEDFINSPGIRRQYEIFSAGGSSDFIKQAEEKRRTDEAESSARSSGLVTGMAMGSMMGGSR